MSTSEKTHIFVIVAVILGGLMLLGCVAFGFIFFLRAQSMNMRRTPPKAMAVGNTSKSVGNLGNTKLQITKTQKLPDGQYEVTVIDLKPNENYVSYDFTINNVDDGSHVTVKSTSNTAPLPDLVETVLLVTPAPGEDKVRFSYTITRIRGKRRKSITLASLLIDLQIEVTPLEKPIKPSGSKKN